MVEQAVRGNTMFGWDGRLYYNFFDSCTESKSQYCSCSHCHQPHKRFKTDVK
uniref:Uncharacterized protein n=1 Tax=Arundo donax TaxID=35708 RepID=A0A0A8ZW95_ARUDO